MRFFDDGQRSMMDGEVAVVRGLHRKIGPR